MKKRVFIVHGWDGHPQANWFPWLKKELVKKGFEVSVPKFLDSQNPRIYNWVPKLTKAVGKPDESTYFIGHSLGCQTIVRYLETLPKDMKVGGAVFVAGFFQRLTGLEDEPGIPETENHWLNTPVNLQKAKSHLNKSIAIFSDNDPYISLDNQDEFRDELGSRIVVEHNMFHFDEGHGITEIPIAFNSILEFAKK